MWSLICPRRASRGSVRAVSTISVRADLLVASTASAAERARSNAISEAATAPWATREVSATPPSADSAAWSTIGTTSSGNGAWPLRHLIQDATVGQVWVAAFDPTTSPKCPARIRYS